jgi:hypothetical protein
MASVLIEVVGVHHPLHVVAALSPLVRDGVLQHVLAL